ncbi:hypothetical protein HAX54_000976, partial [Datura stramonium]|nr:hypothetical protein [Datura stramonium]
NPSQAVLHVLTYKAEFSKLRRSTDYQLVHPFCSVPGRVSGRILWSMGRAILLDDGSPLLDGREIDRGVPNRPVSSPISKDIPVKDPRRLLPTNKEGLVLTSTQDEST